MNRRSHQSLRAKILQASLLLVVLTLFITSNAQAHAILLRSDPVDGANLSASPGEIRLWFDEPVSAQFSSARLYDLNSQPLEIISLRTDPQDPTQLVLALPKLSAGLYSLIYKAFSENDGHYSQGTLVFGIGEGVDSSLVATQSLAFTPPPIPEVFLRWMNFTLLAILVGTVAIVLFVLTPGINAAESQATSSLLKAALLRAIRFAGFWSAFSSLVWMGFLLWQAFELVHTLPDSSSIWAVIWRILAQSRWGVLWLVRQVNLLILSVLFIYSYQKLRMKPQNSMSYAQLSRSWLLIAPLSLSLLVVQALSSHASGLSTDTALALMVDTIHLLAASCWVGGLLALVIGLFPELRKKGVNFATLIKASWKPFSKVAAISVAILFVTGLYSTGRQVASLDALITTFYGGALLMKIVLVVMVGGFGLLNSMILHPALVAPLAGWISRPPGWTPIPLRKLPVLIIAEGSLGILVLVLVSFLTASAAPRGAEYTVAPDQIPGALSQNVDDLVVTLLAKPNRPGQNVFTVFARSTRRPAPAEIARVILRFESLEKDTGRASAVAEQIEPDRYLVSGSYFSFAGPWQVEVVVRRLGMKDSVAQFNWVVVPPGGTRPLVLSKAPLEPYLIYAGAIMLLLCLSGVVLVWLGQRWRKAAHHVIINGRQWPGYLLPLGKPESVPVVEPSADGPEGGSVIL